MTELPAHDTQISGHISYTLLKALSRIMPADANGQTEIDDLTAVMVGTLTIPVITAIKNGLGKNELLQLVEQAYDTAVARGARSMV